MQNISPEMRIAVTELASDPEIELFEIDLTHIGGIRCRFYNGMNGQRKPLIWQKQVYDPYPVSGEGFTYSGKGPSGRPTITLSNLFGLITGIVSQLDGAGGGYVIRRVVKSRFLDADNFEGGNPDADPSQEIISRWVIEQVTSLNNKTASFMLAAPSETDGAMLPCRLFCRTCVRGGTGLPNVVTRVRRSLMNGVNQPVTRQRTNAANDCRTANSATTSHASGHLSPLPVSANSISEGFHD